MKSKTFPKLQIILIFFIIFLLSCQKEKTLPINKEQFIEIYARLLIINEMKFKKAIYNRLLSELYLENNITTADIDSTVSYYNSNPSEWVEIYNLVREKIQKIRSEYRTESSRKLDSLKSSSRRTLPEKFYKKNPSSDDMKKELTDEGKKSDIDKNVKSKLNKDKLE